MATHEPPIRAGEILETPVERINHRTLKNEQGRVFREYLRSGVAVAVENNHEIDGYLLPPETFEAARETLQRLNHQLAQIRAVLPLLLVTARSGVAVPSSTLEDLGIDQVFDWRALNELQARFGVELTHDEDGALMPPRITNLRQELFAEEDDAELIIGD